MSNNKYIALKAMDANNQMAVVFIKDALARASDRLSPNGEPLKV